MKKKVVILSITACFLILLTPQRLRETTYHHPNEPQDRAPANVLEVPTSLPTAPSFPSSPPSSLPSSLTGSAAPLLPGESVPATAPLAMPSTAPRSAQSPALVLRPAPDHARSAVRAAIESGDLVKLRDFLARGLNPDSRSEHRLGYPLLLIAVSQAQPEAVKLLLGQGANPNARDAQGTPMLIVATTLLASPASTAALDAYRLLIEAGHADARRPDRSRLGDGRTALHEAAAHGQIEAIRILLKNGADLNGANTYGETPLHFAAERGRTQAVALLLEAGANADRATRHTGMTALMLAADQTHAEVVDLLLRHGSSALKRNVFGQNALDLAARARARAVTLAADATLQALQNFLGQEAASLSPPNRVY